MPDVVASHAPNAKHIYISHKWIYEIDLGALEYEQYDWEHLY